MPHVVDTPPTAQENLNEPGVVAVLDEVGDVGTAERVEVQPGIEAEGVAIGDEPRVQPLVADSPPAFGRPGRRIAVDAEVGPDLGEPLVEHARRPAEDRQHAEPFRR